MKRYTNDVLNESIQKINNSNLLNNSEFFVSRHDNKKFLYLHNKNKKNTILILEGNNKKCGEFVLSISIYLISNETYL